MALTAHMITIAKTLKVKPEDIHDGLVPLYLRAIAKKMGASTSSIKDGSIASYLKIISNKIETGGMTGGETVDINTDATTSIELENNTEYRRGEIETLVLTLPESMPEAFVCQVCFTSGDDATAVTMPDGVTLVGDAVKNGAFVPVANYRYGLMFWFDGIVTWCAICAASLSENSGDDNENNGNEPPDTGDEDDNGSDSGGNTTDGSGTEANPYLIATAADLKALADEVDAGDTKSGVYYALSADIDLSVYEEWNPIGANGKDNAALYPDSAASFAGTLDGRGHIISNMNVSTPMYGGLFGSNFKGTVMNLGIESGEVSLTVDKSTCGAIARKGTGKIINCYSRVPCGATARSAGIIDETENGAMVLGCYQASKVTHSTTAYAIKAATTTNGTIKYNLWDSTLTANGVNGTASSYANNSGITTAEFATAHETLNNNLAAVAAAAGISESKLCRWTASNNGYPRLVVA